MSVITIIEGHFVKVFQGDEADFASARKAHQGFGAAVMA
jgi:hypothetical protein